MYIFIMSSKTLVRKDRQAYLALDRCEYQMTELSVKPAVQMWPALSQAAFDRTFCQPVTTEMDTQDQNDENIPICSTCNFISFDLNPLEHCKHLACQKCLNALKSHSGGFVCRKCTELGAAVKDSSIEDQLLSSLKQEVSELKEHHISLSHFSEESSVAMLEESVQSIRKAVLAASKHCLCFGCLNNRKQKTPDVTCTDCNISFCEGCGIKHKADNAGHVMLPEKQDDKHERKTTKPRCQKHPDVVMALFCKDCETSICHVCAKTQHSQCLSVTTQTTLAQEEKERLRECSKQHSEVVKVFSEEQQQTQEALITLNNLKKESQVKVRAFFSTLIKACMDTEGTLLHELEMTVSDHVDILQEQVQAWVHLQQQTQHLLELADLIPLLYPGDLLPLSAATKIVLNKLLRQGENLVASAPPAMTLSLCLEQSSQRAVVKRINEIGQTALTIHTHAFLTLKEVTTTSFKVLGEHSEPLVTGLLLVNPQLLIAADFNNYCLKALRRETGRKEWSVTNVLKLKCRPHSITLIPKFEGGNGVAYNSETAKLNNRSAHSVPKGDVEQTAAKQQLESDEGKIFDDQTVPLVDKKPLVDDREQIAISSPDGQYLVASIPIMPSAQMSVIYSVQTDRGYWGLASINKSLVASHLDQGRADLAILNEKGIHQRPLPLTSPSSSDVLVSPRHLAIADQGSHIIVSDQGKKAVFSLAPDGKVLFTFTGHGGEHLDRPEGLCVDSQGHTFVVDSTHNSLIMLTSAGHLLRQTMRGHYGLNCPQAVCVDRNSQIYISNHSGKVLNVYEML